MTKRFAWAALVRWLAWSLLYIASHLLRSREVRGRALARWVAADRTIRAHLELTERGNP